VYFIRFNPIEAILRIVFGPVHKRRAEVPGERISGVKRCASTTDEYSHFGLNVPRMVRDETAGATDSTSNYLCRVVYLPSALPLSRTGVP
jgi:hypothetical protein